MGTPIGIQVKELKHAICERKKKVLLFYKYDDSPLVPNPLTNAGLV